MVCGKCGASNPEGGRFCLRCGAPLARPEPPVEPETSPPAAPSVPAVTAPEQPNRDKEEKQIKPQPKRQKSSAGKVLLAVLLTFLITAVAAVVLQLTGTLDRLLPDLSETRPAAEDTGDTAEDPDE